MVNVVVVMIMVDVAVMVVVMELINKDGGNDGSYK